MGLEPPVACGEALPGPPGNRRTLNERSFIRNVDPGSQWSPSAPAHLVECDVGHNRGLVDTGPRGDQRQ